LQLGQYEPGSRRRWQRGTERLDNFVYTNCADKQRRRRRAASQGCTPRSRHHSAPARRACGHHAACGRRLRVSQANAQHRHTRPPGRRLRPGPRDRCASSAASRSSVAARAGRADPRGRGARTRPRLAASDLRIRRRFRASSRAGKLALIEQEPPLTGDARFDAALAGVAEHFAREAGLAAPAWVQKPERCVEPWWFISSRPELDAYTLAHTPAVFARHGVFIAREVFDRA
jgi:hypothetical protein